MAKKQKNGQSTSILQLPFLFIFNLVNYFFIGITFVFSPVIFFLKYVSLGCYYTVYVVFFPLIYIISKIVDISYASSNKQKMKSAIKIEEYIPQNEQKEDEEKTEEKEQSVSDLLKKKYEEFELVKKQRAKEQIQIKELIRDIQKNNYRSETPIVFKYTVIDNDHKKTTNIFIAHSKLEVLTYLQNEGYKVLKIETSKLLNILYDPTKTSPYKFNNKDLIFWLTQLSTYLKAGIPLTQAMRVLSKQMSKNKNKKRLFDSIIYNLTLGETFSSALAKQGKSFPALLISMIKTAEATGKLEETLDDMSAYYTELENTRKAMISAMSYPAIISIFSVAVVTFIMLNIIPQFQTIYSTSGAQINSFTLALINISNYLKGHIFNILLMVVAIAATIILLYKKVKVIRKYMQTFIMKIPMVGKIVIYKEISIFTKTFASLLQNNVFITESMSLLSEVTSNEIYREIMFRTIYYIAKGDKISTAFKDHWAIPDVAYYMIVTGESTGELAGMMAKVADYYQTEHKTIIESLKAFIEPTLIIFLAVVVGGIVMAVILPMFGLYQQIM